MRTISSILACCIVLGLPVVASAETPDGETPAEESICDLLKTATPGLYGLCVAYCEAHDSHLLSPDGDPDALDVPSLKILENYNRKRQETDPPMPCVQDDPCPCWTEEQLTELVTPTPEQANTNFFGACADGPIFGLDPIIVIECRDPVLEPEETECFWQVSLRDSDGELRCAVANETQSGNGPPTNGQEITAEQFTACEALLRARAEPDATSEVWPCFLP
jgi:hypothetical protein